MDAIRFTISILQVIKQKLRMWKQLFCGHITCKWWKMAMNLNLQSLRSMCFGFVPLFFSSPIHSEQAQLSWVNIRARKEILGFLHYFHLGSQSRGTKRVSRPFLSKPEFPLDSDANQLVEHMRPHEHTIIWVINYHDHDLAWPGLERRNRSAGPSSFQTHSTGLIHWSNTQTFVPFSLLLISGLHLTSPLGGVHPGQSCCIRALTHLFALSCCFTMRSSFSPYI